MPLRRLMKTGQGGHQDVRIAICDDEASQRDYLRQQVEGWAARRGHALSVHLFASAEAFLFAYDEDKSFDILLLDIQMGKMDGVALAKRLRADNEWLQIVFITGFSEFISEGYEVSALHYLLKPVDEEKLVEVLDRAVSRLQTAPRMIVFRRGSGYIRIPADEIYYAEAFSHSVTLVTKDGKETFNMRLSDMEEILGEGFFRCHRSYIVSMKHVRRVTRTALVLDNGAEIPLSRSLYDAANQAFIKTYF
ncbi:MAG: LytR/AlgR family response regulator transcription factor [Bacillota bacterium]